MGAQAGELAGLAQGGFGLDQQVQWGEQEPVQTVGTPTAVNMTRSGDGRHLRSEQGQFTGKLDNELPQHLAVVIQKYSNARLTLGAHDRAAQLE